MKSNPSQPLRTSLEALLIATTLLATAQIASAQTTTWAGAGPDQYWGTPANWTTVGGSIPPAATDNVIFPNGAFPVSVDGYDNIITNNTTIGSLSYLNVSPNIHTTHLNAGATLTVNGPFTEGVASSTTVVTMSGDGNFTINNISGTASIGGSGGSTETVTLNLADGTNTFNVKTLSLGESASNNGRNCNLNLGNGPTIFNADAVQFGTGKASGFVQWPAASTNGNLVIRDHTGSGRATILLGNGTSGSGGSKGTITATGHAVDILGGTVTLGRLGNTTGTQTGTLIADNGTVNVTSLLMGIIPATGTGAGLATGNTLTIGGNETNTAVLTVNAAGGGSFVVSGSTNSARNASATFNLLTNGTANIFCPISKAAGANNTATLNLSGMLNMQAATNTIGTRTAPIDNVTLDFATLNLGQDGSSVSLAAINLNLNDTNTVNFISLPPIITLPTTIPIISYTNLGGSVLNLGVGTLPGDYHGHLVDDAAGTISLVVDSGTVVAAKQDIWIGGVNTNWDVTTLNWTNSGASVTNYTEADFVTFNDIALTGNVTLLGSQHAPSGLTVNNTTLNYVLSGSGKISGGTALVKSGAGSLTLADTGGDNFSGGIFVHGGTLLLDNANSSLPGGLTNDPGTTVQIGNNDAAGALPGGTVLINGSLVFSQSNNRTVSAAIAGSGSVTQNGSNTLALTGANTYSGNTLVSRGTLALTGGGSVASPIVAVQNATLNINAANVASFGAVTLTNGILNVGAGTNSPNFTSLSLTNSTINMVANYNNVGGQAILAGGVLTAGGTTNILNVTSVQNLPLSPSLPFNIPLVAYTSASFPGGFNFGWANLPGITGYITNNSANNSVDLVITSAPQNLAWNGGSATGNNWSDAANWTGIPIVALDALTFDGLLRTNNVNDTPPGTTYVGLTFNNSAGDAPFTISGAPINLTGTALNNSADVQTIKLGLNVTGGVTLNGGAAGGSLAVLGGITNFSTANQTVTLLGNGIVSDLCATNSGTNGGGQLTLQLGDAGGDWTVVDGTGSGSLVQAGNLQLSLNAGAGGGSIEFGSTNSAPNVDAGYPSNGVVTITGSAGTFNMNNGTLKANAVSIGNGGTVNAFFNMNGGTMILGPGSFTAAGGNGATVFIGSITNGALYSTNGGSVILAQRASGTLSISGGLLDCNTLNLSSGTAASGVGVFNLNGGGRLVCTNVSVGSSAGNGSGTLNFNGGILQPGANSAALFKQNNLVPLTNNVQAGGAIFDTAGFNATVNWPLQTDPALGGAPDGGLTKLGAGTLSLTSPDTFIGNTLVGAGTLLINSVQGPSLVIVSNGATLGGNGTIGNNVTVNTGGTLAPGNNAIGTLTVNGNASLAGTTAMEINKTLGTNDLLLATNATPSTITYSGTLNVTTLAGTLAVSDSFKLFSASNYLGSFSAIIPATPGAGLAWNTNNLTVNGTLSVVAGVGAPTTNATITKVTLSGTNLLVHGTNNNSPNNQGRYVVFATTNITVPLGNWTPVSTNFYNNDGTLDFTNPIVPGTPQQYYDVKSVQ